jgi:hypothetical protein
MDGILPPHGNVGCNGAITTCIAVTARRPSVTMRLNCEIGNWGTFGVIDGRTRRCARCVTFRQRPSTDLLVTARLGAVRRQRAGKMENLVE